MSAPETAQGDPNDPHTLLTAVFHYYCRFGRTGAKGVGEKTLGTTGPCVHVYRVSWSVVWGKKEVLTTDCFGGIRTLLWSPDNANFVKLCRDCPHLLGNTLSNTDVDLIFVKCKKKGERRLTYARFLNALGMIAGHKYSNMVRRRLDTDHDTH